MSDTDRVERRGGRLGDFLRRPWLVGGCLALACFGVGAIISQAVWPVPRVHDEFSYLLAADTFAQGRLTNPTHPKWEHLETFHEIFQPTYASKYPPGQGLALAAGQVLTGKPAAGLWMLSGLAAAATYWMLLGWTSSKYATLGALLWIAHPRFQLVWGQTFWGGTLAYIGGALVFGAAIRMQRRAWVRDAVAMATGALVLAVTRPYEGFVFCAATGGWLVWHWIRHGGLPLRHLLLKLALPQAVILAAGAVALGAYHKAVTGDARAFPYAVHEATYGQCPMFIGGTPAPRPAYRHAVFDDFHSVWELGWFERQATLRDWLHTKVSVTWLAGLFFLTPILAVGIFASRPWRWRRLTPAVVVAAVTYTATLAVTWYNPHYWAPFAPLVLLAATAGLRRIDVLGRQAWGDLRLAPLLVAAQVVLFLLAAIQFATHPQRDWAEARTKIVEQLDGSPGKHLILVRYGAEHNCHAEWVFNAADIDASKVVWARSMDSAKDDELISYYADRQAWLLEPEARRLMRLPHETSALASSKKPSLAHRVVESAAASAEVNP